MKRSAFVCGALLLALSSAAPAHAQRTVQVGTLNCKMGPTVGLVVGSVQRMSCTFNTNTGGREYYSATFKRIGLDLGISAGGRMAWAVFAPTQGIAPRALAGKYVGASGDIAVGLGVGANALVGGSRRTIALQPVSVEGQVGINVALGAAGLRLR
jgi:hypothetical protein